MYYVSFIGDPDELAASTHCSMAIRSVFTENKDWLSYDDLTDLEKKRIQKRFEDEIVAKLKWRYGLIEVIFAAGGGCEHQPADR